MNVYMRSTQQTNDYDKKSCNFISKLSILCAYTCIAYYYD